MIATLRSGDPYLGDLAILQADAQAYSPSQGWGLWNWMALSAAGARLGTGETWGFVAGVPLGGVLGMAPGDVTTGVGADR